MTTSSPNANLPNRKLAQSQTCPNANLPKRKLESAQMLLTSPTRDQPIVLRAVSNDNPVLTSDALSFLGALHSKFDSEIRDLLAARKARQIAFDQGVRPDFLPHTASIRESVWQAAPIPAALQDRRVEITGPVDAKMIINALNSGARVFMADFEDATSPSFANILVGHANMLDYRDGKLGFEDATSGKKYEVGPNPALLIVRPRGLHMREENVLVDGVPIAAALFDFGLNFYHVATALSGQGRGPFYYLPKLESHLEARLWDQILRFSQERLGLTVGTVKLTVLIETLPAAFEMDEIIWELRDHIVGLNCGRWDYIFSYIKTLRHDPTKILPDRELVGMDRAFLAAYSARLVQTCHRRGIHAMGGMAAQIPNRNDPEANARAFEKVRADKLREVTAGHDGTWVAHPDLVPIAMEVFDREMPSLNQIHISNKVSNISPVDMLAPHSGAITQRGLVANVSVGIAYLASWLVGRGAVPLNGLMEDAATAEISRMQVWQWLSYGCEVQMEDGGQQNLSADWLGVLIQEELNRLRTTLSQSEFDNSQYRTAARIFHEAVIAETPPDFITTPAYAILNALN
jgi:malate synthase